MPLLDKIEEDFKKAVRSKETAIVATLRLIKSALQYKKIDNKGELTDKDVLTILKTQAKQRKESIELYKKGGRDDLAAKEEAELKIINAYLPEQMSAEELEKLVETTIKEIDAQGPKEIGKVMKALMPKLGGRADGKMVNEIVRKLLS